MMMMRSFRFCVLLLLVGTAALFFLAKTITPTLPDTIFELGKKDSTLITATSRKLKKNDELNVEDYGPNDPVPSSKATIHHRPIQHGTPLMPYIPKPSPASPPSPSRPKRSVGLIP